MNLLNPKLIMQIRRKSDDAGIADREEKIKN